MTMKFIWLIKSAFALQREHVSFHSQTEMTQTENVVVTSALFRVFQNFFREAVLVVSPKKLIQLVFDKNCPDLAVPMEGTALQNI